MEPAGAETSTGKPERVDERGRESINCFSELKQRNVDLVQRLVTMPGYINYGRLKLHPLWRPLQGDPRFEEIVNSLAPK